MPLSGLNQSLDPFEQLGLVFLNPLVQNCFVMVEDKVLGLFTEIRSRAERRNGFTRAFFPFPLPDGIEMRVAHKVNYGFGHLISSSLWITLHPQFVDHQHFI
jgi:hypothetical protein